MLNIGVSWESLGRYIEDNIFTLPGIESHRDKLTVVLTGSRAIGTYTDSSDADIDVICSKEDYDFIQAEMYKRKLTPNIKQGFYNLPKENWDKYFGEGVGRPHFTITPIDVIKRQIEEYQDTPLWIWSNALVMNDPNNQFRNIIDKFQGYPQDVLIKKIKYRYLLSSYWFIDGYPHNHSRNEDLFSASLSLLKGIHELYRLFYILEGKPYPYTEKLALYVTETKLGQRFKPFLDRIVNMVIGVDEKGLSSWERLDKAIELILYGNISPEANQLSDACDASMIDVGVEEDWVKAGYDNIDELLYGELGPTP